MAKIHSTGLKEYTASDARFEKYKKDFKARLPNRKPVYDTFQSAEPVKAEPRQVKLQRLDRFAGLDFD
jgi:hypothetical protein